MGNIKISDKTLDRLRKHVAAKYEGKMWGQVSGEIEKALNQYLDKEEKFLKKIKKETK
jgi:hypothetical protein